jgi:O-antigen/teichoic acid export membrane protein
MPVSVGFLLFPGDFLGIIGNEYPSASTALAIFMISLPFSILTEIIYYYAYAKGDNRSLLLLGLSGNLPRVFLYFLLVPVLGLNGSAIAYAIGTGIQMIFSVKLAKSYSMKLEPKFYIIVSLIPIIIGIPFVILDLNFIGSIIAILLITMVLYIKLSYIKKKEIHLVIYSIFSKNQADRLYHLINRIYDRINREG